MSPIPAFIRTRRSARRVMVVLVLAVCPWLSAQTFAAEKPESDRSVPGSVVPSTGTTAGPGASRQDQRSEPSSASAGSQSAPRQADTCATLRKKYARSQACFSRFRLKNGGLKPGAFQRCKEVTDPSLQCGPAIVP